MKDVFQCTFSRQLVSVAIRTAGMSKVKTRTRVVRKPEDYIQRVYHFLREVDRFKREDRHIVCVDEMGFDDKALPFKGYTTKGQRLYISNARGSWSRISVAAAITEEGTTATYIRKGSFRSQTFATFLDKLPLPSGTVVIMDNVAFHKAPVVQDVLLKKGWTSLFTPPYSPWYNPIENVFGVVRRRFQDARAQMGREAVDDNIVDVESSTAVMVRQIQEAFDDVATSTSTVVNCFGRFWDIVEEDLKVPHNYRAR